MLNLKFLLSIKLFEMLSILQVASINANRNFGRDEHMKKF